MVFFDHSTNNSRLFRLTFGRKAKVEKLTVPAIEDIRALKMVFTADSKYLIVGAADHTVRAISIFSEKVIVFDEHTKTAENKRPAIIRTLAVSPDSKWIASGDLQNNIHIFDLKKRKVQGAFDSSHALQLHATLPILESLHMNFAFIPQTSHIIVIYGDSSYYIYDYENGVTLE